MSTDRSASEVELTRLREIADLGLAGELHDPRLDAIAGRVAAVLSLPMAIVTIVSDGAQLFVASFGLGGWLAEVPGTPVEWSFCKFTVAERRPFVVSDTHLDPRVRSNPLVTQDKVRCYLGVPLISSRGVPLGALCGLGMEPRTFSDADTAALTALAEEVVAIFEARRALAP